MNRAVKAAAGLALAAAFAVPGCGEGGSPAGGDIKQGDPRLTKETSARTVFENAEDFNNVVAFCDGTTRVYTTTEFPVVYVTDDLQCGGTGQHSQMSWFPK